MPTRTPPDAAVWTDPTCPVARSADLIGDRWSLLIIRDAMDEARTFTEFRRRTGIARNILTDRLHRLVGHGILDRVDPPSGARKVYELTDAGKDLFPVIVALRQWGERHAFAPDESHSVLTDHSGREVPPMILRSAGGDALTSDTTVVHH